MVVAFSCSIDVIVVDQIILDSHPAWSRSIVLAQNTVQRNLIPWITQVCPLPNLLRNEGIGELLLDVLNHDWQSKWRADRHEMVDGRPGLFQCPQHVIGENRSHR